MLMIIIKGTNFGNKDTEKVYYKIWIKIDFSVSIDVSWYIQYLEELEQDGDENNRDSEDQARKLLCSRLCQ